MGAMRSATVAVILAAAVGATGSAQPVKATRDGVIVQAWRMAERLPLDQQGIVKADIALVVRGWDPEDGYKKLEHAGFATTQVPADFDRALATQAVGRRVWDVDEKWARGMFENAESIAAELPEGWAAQRSLVYTEVADAWLPHDPEQTARLLKLAAEQARAVPADQPDTRIAALRDVSEAYRGVDPDAAQALFGEALAAALKLPGLASNNHELTEEQRAQQQVLRDLVLAGLAGSIAQRSLQQAIEVTGTIVDEGARSQALREVALNIPPAEAAMALELASSITEAPTRVRTLADLGLSLSLDAPEAARNAAEAATAGAAELEADDTGNEARAQAAECWAFLDVDRGLELAADIKDEYYGEQARGRIALHLADVDSERALSILESLERSVVTADPLLVIATSLAEKDPMRAFELVGRIRSYRARIEAYIAIAPHLPTPTPEGE